MTKKNTCIACPTSSKAGIALLLIGFALILLSYAYPFIKSRIGKKR